MLGDRVLAEEVVQEVFVRTWRQPERYDPDRGSMRSFLLAQVHGRAVDLLRAENARRAREQREAFRSRRASTTTSNARSLDLAEAEAVRAALDDARPTASAPRSSSRTSAATPTKRSRCCSSSRRAP